jgi:tetratricopeptide (TPR) repeat protein
VKARSAWRWGLGLVCAAGLGGCDKMLTRDATRSIAEADKKVSTGDFRGALRLYESSLDGTARTAQAHYKLALLYDDKLKRPRAAQHHLDRYLELDPEGKHAREAKTMRAENEKRLAATAGAGSPMSQSEAVKLKNRNADLEKRLVELQTRKAATPFVRGKVDKAPAGARSHTVEAGDTLASIARKFYKNQAKAKDILDANYNSLGGKDVIRVGQTLIIP